MQSVDIEFYARLLCRLRYIAGISRYLTLSDQAQVARSVRIIVIALQLLPVERLEG